MKFLSVTFKLLMVLFFISLSACGGGGGNNNSGNTTQTGDTTPPADVSNVTSASNSEGSASLSWINPTDTDFAGVMIRRSSSGFPQSATDGELVYEGMAETFEDSGLYGIEWFYSIFSYDNAQPINYSTPQTFSVTPIDTTAPTIVQQQPAPAATNVNYQSNVTIKFQEILDPASIINSISLCYEYQTTQSIPYPPYYQTITKCNPVSGSTNFDSQNMSLVFTQAGGKFLFNRVYRVTLNAGISDITGNSTTTSSSWKFTTEADSYPPIVTGTTQIDGEVEVPVSTQVQINFNEVIDNTTVSLSTVTLSGMSGTVSRINNTDILVSTATGLLPYDTNISITVDGVTDSFGNQLSSPYQFSFTTEKDLIAPTITKHTLLNNQKLVSTQPTFNITFSEPMDETSLSNIVLEDDTGTPITGNISYDIVSFTATFTPLTALTPDSDYVFRIGSAVADTQGNILGADDVRNFATASAAVKVSQITKSLHHGQVVKYDNAGNGWSAWIANSGTSYRVMYSLYTQAGGWSNEIVIASNDGTCNCKLKMSEDGSAVVWKDHIGKLNVATYNIYTQTSNYSHDFGGAITGDIYNFTVKRINSQIFVTFSTYDHPYYRIATYVSSIFLASWSKSYHYASQNIYPKYDTVTVKDASGIERHAVVYIESIIEAGVPYTIDIYLDISNANGGFNTQTMYSNTSGRHQSIKAVAIPGPADSSVIVYATEFYYLDQWNKTHNEVGYRTYDVAGQTTAALLSKPAPNSDVHLGDLVSNGTGYAMLYSFIDRDASWSAINYGTGTLIRSDYNWIDPIGEILTVHAFSPTLPSGGISAAKLSSDKAGDYALLWNDQSNLTATHFDGTAWGSNSFIVATGLAGDYLLTTDSTSYAATWEYSDGTYGASFGNNSGWTSPVDIITSVATVSNYSIESMTDGYAITWDQDQTMQMHNITAAAGYALADLTLQSPITLSADSLVSGSIGKTYSATNGNTVTVVWEQYDSGVMGIFSSVYNEGGGWSSPHQLSTNGSLPSIVATSSGYVSTWAEDSGIMVNRYTDATGSWDANPVQAYDSAGTRVEALAIAQGNSEFMLAWSAPAPLDILATSSSSDALSWGLPSMLATSSGNDLRLISDGLGYLMSTNGLFAIYHHDGTQWDMTPSQLSFNPVQNYELESNGSSYAVIVTGGYTHVYENGTWTPRIMLDFSTGCYSNDIISIESTSYGYIALWGDDFGSGSYLATCIADFDNTGWLSSPNRFEPVMSGPLRENNGGYNIIHTVTDPATGEIDLASAYYINGKTGRSAGLIDNTTGNPLKDSIELHVINSGRISAKYVSNNNGETSLWGIGGR